jgi:hypothetical protein
MVLVMCGLLDAGVWLQGVLVCCQEDAYSAAQTAEEGAMGLIECG